MANYVRSPKKVEMALQIADLTEQGLGTTDVARRLGISRSLAGYYKRVYKHALADNVVRRLRKLLRRMEARNEEQEDIATVEEVLELLISPVDEGKSKRND